MHPFDRRVANARLRCTQTLRLNSDRRRCLTRGSVARLRSVSAVMVALSALAASPAAGVELRLHLEPSFAMWLDPSHADRFASGLHFAVRPTLSLAPAFDVQASYAIFYTPATHDHSADNTAHLIYAGLRARPFAAARPEADELGGLFIDANGGYVRMGDHDTFGFDVGVGYDFLLSPWFSVGAVVRFGYILGFTAGPDDAEASQDDGQLLTVGMDFGFGPTRSD